MIPYVLKSIFIILLVVGTVTDLKSRLLPNKLTVSGIAFGLIIHVTESILLSSISPIIDSAAGLFACGGFLFLVAFVSKGGMGMGDVKFSAMIGAYLGFKYGIIALFTAIILGGAFGLILIALKKATRKTAVPFGPFLALGSVAAVFFESPINNLIQGLIKQPFG
ncbi:MAG: A24 family peptidase [Clostridiales bacterium]|jgi:leader peptidase (prepilin peptidase)/N-methyltransferase|nr:A24 family peptidase [Clostridiales bacterium]